jgi:hypothetical protein
MRFVNEEWQRLQSEVVVRVELHEDQVGDVHQGLLHTKQVFQLSGNG